MIPIETLIRPISSDELFELLLDALETVEIPARSWRPGGVARSKLAVLADRGARGAALVSSLIAGGFLLLGKGDYLTAHAIDVYGVERIAATYAAGFVAFSNAGGAVYSVDADEMIIRSSNTGARFRVPAAFVIPAASGATPGTVTVAVTAIEPGSASSVAPAEIDELETPLARVTVTNAASVVGRDAESDEALVKRCLGKRGTWSPLGPRDAYEYAALSSLLTDGSPTSINRVAVSRFSSTGQVTVACATPSGTPTSDELDAARAAIEAQARPDSVTCTVFGAIPVATTHAATIWARGGTEAILRANAQKAVDDLIGDYPIGGIAKTEGGQGYLFADRMEAAIIGSSPEIFDVDFEDDSDIALDPNEVATNVTTFVVRIK